LTATSSNLTIWTACRSGWSLKTLRSREVVDPAAHDCPVTHSRSRKTVETRLVR
jgi:hypothetical protein